VGSACFSWSSRGGVVTAPPYCRFRPGEEFLNRIVFSITVIAISPGPSEHRERIDDMPGGKDEIRLLSKSPPRRSQTTYPMDRLPVIATLEATSLCSTPICSSTVLPHAAQLAYPVIVSQRGVIGSK
jgi:hypothetical protein